MPFPNDHPPPDPHPFGTTPLDVPVPAEPPAPLETMPTNRPWAHNPLPSVGDLYYSRPSLKQAAPPLRRVILVERHVLLDAVDFKIGL
jgi:hypothetical protein